MWKGKKVKKDKKRSDSIPEDGYEIPQQYKPVYRAEQEPYTQMHACDSPSASRPQSYMTPPISPPISFSAPITVQSNKVNYREVKVSGSSITGSEVMVNEVAGFYVDTSKAGTAILGVIITDPSHQNVNVGVRVVQDGLHECSFIPTTTGLHTVSICFSFMNITGSPYKINVVAEMSGVTRRQNTSGLRKTGRTNSEPIPASTTCDKRPLRRHHTMCPPDLEAPDVLSIISAELRTSVVKHIIKTTSFDMGEQIGKGHFGDVYTVRMKMEGSGAAMNAAKTLKDLSHVFVIEFFREAELMSNFKHENVLPLIGIVLHQDNPFIIIPLMDQGNLKDYLQAHTKEITPAKLIDYCQQVSQGMVYVASLKFVHRDLAARNCLLNSEGVVKICDFGLARDNFKENYVMLNKCKQLPIRWMAPEITKNWTFTTVTDVWAYSVLMWEIMTFGEEPYKSLDDMYLVTYLNSGNRLEKPESASTELYELMLKCWELEPKNRPTFIEISKILNQIGQAAENIIAAGYKNVR